MSYLTTYSKWNKQGSKNKKIIFTLLDIDVQESMLFFNVEVNQLFCNFHQRRNHIFNIF